MSDNLKSLKKYFNLCPILIYMALNLLLVSSLYAFEVTPLIIEIKDVARPSSKSITVSNPSDEALAVETIISRIFYSGTGKRTLKPIDDEDLIIYPEMKSIPSNGYQRFLVQWVGSPLKESKAYLLSFSQVPINVRGSPKKTNNKINILLTFNVIIHVSPADGKAVLSSTSDGRFTSSDKNQFINFTVENSGNSYAFLSDYNISIFGEKKLVDFLPGELKAMGIDVFFPPKSKSEIKIPVKNFPVDFERAITLNFNN